MTFPEAVRQEIDRRGMPLAVLARRAGVSRPTVYALLSGGQVSNETLRRVSRALGLEDPSEASMPAAV